MRLGKGLKPRTTVLSDLDALPLAERWFEERGKLKAVGQGVPLLCTLKGTPTDPSYTRHLLPGAWGTMEPKAALSGAAFAPYQ